MCSRHILCAACNEVPPNKCVEYIESDCAVQLRGWHDADIDGDDDCDFAIGFLFDYSESDDVGWRKIEILCSVLHDTLFHILHFFFGKNHFSNERFRTKIGELEENASKFPIDFQLLICA